MHYKGLRLLRVVVALFVLITIGIFFLNLESLPTKYPKVEEALTVKLPAIFDKNESTELVEAVNSEPVFTSPDDDVNSNETSDATTNETTETETQETTQDPYQETSEYPDDAQQNASEENASQENAPDENEANQDAPAEEPAKESEPTESEANQDAQTEEPAKETEPAESEANQDAQTEEPAKESEPTESEANQDAQTEEPAKESEPAESEANQDAQSEEPAKESAPAENEANQDAQTEEPAKESAPAENGDDASPEDQPSQDAPKDELAFLASRVAPTYAQEASDDANAAKDGVNDDAKTVNFAKTFETLAPRLVKIQFLPAILAGSVGIVVALLLATWIFGRVYCSVICPLGIFQDVVAWFGRVFGKFPFLGVLFWLGGGAAFCYLARGGFIALVHSGIASFDAMHWAILAIVGFCASGCVFEICRITKRFKEQKRRPPFRNYAYRRNPFWWRVFFLLLALFSTRLGLAYFGLLEPYGIFGRIAVNVFKPGWLAVNNALAAQGVDGFYYEKIQPESVGALAVGVASFFVVVLFAGRWGRLYCNSVCPVGTILGAISRFSILRVQIDAKRCVKCGMCSKACKCSCIDVEAKQIDSSRCIACFDCFGKCKMGALSYEPKGRIKLQPNEISVGGKKQLKSVDERIDLVDPATLREKDRAVMKLRYFNRGRRNFATLSILAVVGAVAKFAWGKTQNEIGGDAANADAAPSEPERAPVDPEKPDDYGLTPFERRFTISPPGSVSHKRFQEKCVGCHLCVSKCPMHVLKPSGLENGLLGFMQPRVDFERHFCNFDCTICGEVCPTGAILPLTKDEKHVVQMGHVVFIKENCIVYAQETSCGACSEHCPTQAIHMVPYKGDLTIPETDVSICVGCGGCEYICPARPNRAVYIEGNPVHKKATPIAVEETKEVENVDFGF